MSDMAMTPPLKWVGGKRWILPWLSEQWKRFPDYRLVDPFVGGLSVPLGLQPRYAHLTDANPYLINFYKCLQIGLINRPEYDVAFVNDEDVYYDNRMDFNKAILNWAQRTTDYCDPRLALLFYYLNRTGFNGLCRFNRDGEYNVPFGKHDTINYITDFTGYALVLRDWSIQSCDFETLQFGPQDFIYVDPPFDVEFTEYTEKSFTWDDQVRLIRWLHNQPGPAVASNQATPRIIDLYRSWGFEVYGLDGPRRISCTGDRTPAKEIFAVKAPR